MRQPHTLSEVRNRWISGGASKVPLVGLLLNDACDHYVRIANGVLAYLHEKRSLRLVKINDQMPPRTDPVFLCELQGLIGDAARVEWIREMSNRSKPFVFVTDKEQVGMHPHVLPDSEAVGQLASRFWLEREPTSYAFIGPGNGIFSNRRRDIFIRGIEASGRLVHLLPSMRTYPRLSPTAFREFEMEVALRLRLLPKPCGVFAANDYFASLVVRIATADGILVPDEIGVLGVDNDRWKSSQCDVPLTSIDLNSERIGWDAAQLIDQRLRGGMRGPTQIRIPPLGIVERKSTQAVPELDPIVRKAITYLKQHLTESVTVHDLANHCNVSRRMLERRFREELGRSPGEELRNIRFAKAKQLLRETDFTVEWLAERCGFTSVPSFTSSFKARFGETPAHFRKKNHVNPPARG